MMHISKNILLYSPKTAGATMLVVNMSFMNALLKAQERVACIQFSSYPDLHILSGQKQLHNWGEMIAFQNTDEWSVELLSRIAVRGVCDVFHAPSDWSSVNETFLQNMMQLLQSAYDVVYIDMDNSINDRFKDLIIQLSDQSIFVATPDPQSLESLTTAQKRFTPKNAQVIFNQCPSGQISALKQDMKKQGVNILGFIELDPKSAWMNIYEQVPVALQKKSKMKKQIQEIVEVL